MGFVREDGSVGIRNEIWIINTVGCINRTAEQISQEANLRFKGKTDGIFAFPHPFGCSQLGEDHLTTQKILADMVKHPNAAGVLVLGLGCENNNLDEFRKVLGDYDEKRVKFLNSQDTEDEIEAGVNLITELVQYAETFKREKLPASKLVVGLKCGGSDAFSGITANPLVGAFSDMLLRCGGTTILTEVPEMFGAETILMNRCADKEVFNKTVNLINNFKEYFIKHNQPIYENPSPGNKQGGISTLEEKSLGCTQKGGSGKVVDVLDYGERVTLPGLNLLKSPGNDLVSSTALLASGAHIILFTTGRGTPLGTGAPTIKISTTSDLYRRKRNWIDFNAGQLLDGKQLEEVTGDLMDFVLKVASGAIKTKNEQYGFKEIAIFKDGVIL
jgi:altronate hydrolase